MSEFNLLKVGTETRTESPNSTDMESSVSEYMIEIYPQESLVERILISLHLARERCCQKGRIKSLRTQAYHMGY